MSENTTDYNFPDWWGLLKARVEDDEDPLTKEEADEIRHKWFVRQRVWRQVNRQYSAGMWDQWTQKRLNAGIPLEEALARTGRNRFRK